MTDKEKLYNFIRFKKIIPTHEVLRWGLENYSNRAERNARQLAEEKKIIRLTKEEKEFLNIDTSQGVWRLMDYEVMPKIGQLSLF